MKARAAMCKYFIDISMAVLMIHALLVCGCDPVRTVQQKLVVSVTHSKSGKAVDNMVLLVKQDYQLPDYVEKGDEFEPSYLSRWETLPWLRAVTNEKGRAVFVATSTALDGNHQDGLSQKRTVFSGKPFLFRLDDNRPVRAVVDQGMMLEVDGLTLKVEELGEAK